MKFKLKSDGKVKYSKGEQNVFKALGSTARSSTDLLERIYSKGHMPYNGRQIIIGALRSLKRKIIANREPFKLVSSKRSGPHPMEFWLEAK